MVISSSSLKGQYIGVYISEADSNSLVNINKNDIEIFQVMDNFGVEDILERNLILKSEYEIVSDKIVFTQDEKQLYFQGITEDIIQLKSDINHHISFNTKFYCIQKKDKNGIILYFGKWKDGQKDGDWLFFNEAGQRVKVSYLKGREIEQTILKE